MNVELPLDALTTIFIFLIGLPAVLLQTLAPELREIVRKRRKLLVAVTILPIIISALIVLVGIALTFKPDFWGVRPDFILPLRLPEQLNLLWVIILILLVFIAGMAALFLTDIWRREAIIAKLQKSAAKNLAASGRLVQSKLESLIQLGKQSEAGKDKDLVLRALAELAEAVQTHSRYEGRQLDVLVLGLEDILLLGPQKGSSENFRTAADLLSDVVISATRVSSSEDLKFAVRTISVLARTSMRRQPSHIQMKFVDALDLLNAGENSAATWMSQALFEIGSRATETNQVLIAMAALSKLDSLAKRQTSLEGEVAFDYLSLIAHVWYKGETAQRYAAKMLHEAQPLFRPSLREALKAAQAHCEQTAKFRTSDRLMKLARGWQKEEAKKSRTA